MNLVVAGQNGFTPKFDTQSAIRHYVDWLKAGNPK
jgi:hypothetical protein